MAKGFGVKPDKELGYILVLMPEINAYAAKFNLNIKRTKEPFIGITNMVISHSKKRGLLRIK